MSKKSEKKLSELALTPIEISVELNTKNPESNSGLKINRFFTKADIDPYQEIEWESRTSLITDEKGTIISQITDVEVPKTWSQLATDILAYKYFRKAGVPTKEGRETSLKQAVFRIAHTISDFGEKFGYFATHDDRLIFESELTHLLINQKAAFNSPVWFNCGLYHQYGIVGSNGSFYWDFKEQKVLEASNAYKNPQCSACFILSVEDTLSGIFDLLKTESRIFKYGSGSGANFSKLRSRYERISGGGTSSGMMSFLRIFDRAADVVKSGGTTRRAAKMVVVNIDHPEIEDFINWKVKEEKKAQALIESGFSSDFNGEAYHTVSGQNSNNSVRITDEFMEAVEKDAEWTTKTPLNNEPHRTYRARDLMDMIAQAAWKCADPGVQFDTTINEWHTCPNTDRINASNPCSEYMFLDDSACNLASINLLKFADNKGRFDVSAFRHACRIMLIAQEIEVDLSSYPTPTITKNSHDYRPLGLGYANLGALLMVSGIPYDSAQGTATAAAITAIMTGHAYKTSAEISAVKGSFTGFDKNRLAMLNVMKKHRNAAYSIADTDCDTNLISAARQDWDEAMALGEQFKYRNSQTTVIAPTGTIGLLMDCDTTGVEPDFALVKFKKLAGGGSIKIVNSAVSRALENLGYSEQEKKSIIEYALGTGTLSGETAVNSKSLASKGLRSEEIDLVNASLPNAFDINFSFNRHILGSNVFERLGITPEEEQNPSFSFLKKIGYSEKEIEQSNEVICGTQTLEGAPYLKTEHYPIFDCANKCGKKGTRFIAPMAHVKMMAAVQPFISGAISKTINMPNEATVEEVKEVYLQSWKLGLKALALYRDGSKFSQPLNTKKSSEKSEDKTEVKEKIVTVNLPRRRRMPDERQAITHKFRIAGHKGYITIGLYNDGQPGEIFITMSKQGSLISGLMDAFATSISISLQYGVPLYILVNKFLNNRFEPSGFTGNPQIRIAKSITDYIARYLAIKFLNKEDQVALGVVSVNSASSEQEKLPITTQQESLIADDNGNDLVQNDDDDERSELKSESSADAPPCPNCGSMTFKTGTCYTCLSCGSTTGGCS